MTSPRLHVLLARDSRQAVVIRRGPSRHTAVIGWDRSTDHFELGQWLYGRIYERRSDLSPDGKHFIYFAMNGRWNGPAKGSWTAISQVPWLKAQILFAKGDCLDGGGLFMGRDTYWLDDVTRGHQLLHDHTKLRRIETAPTSLGRRSGSLGACFARLQRDGWDLLRERKGTEDAPTVFEKGIDDRWNLRKFAYETARTGVGRSVYLDSHEMRCARTGERIALDDWEWADVDGSRVVWAAKGCLYAGRVRSNGAILSTLLKDFSKMSFERRIAPY